MPPAPVTSLLEITSTSISLHWKVSEKKSEVRYVVLVNGITVGDVAPLDSSISIGGLAPGLCYTVRVVAINNQNFQAASDPIRAQTSRIIPEEDSYDGGVDKAPKVATAPVVVPYKGPHEGLISPITAPSMSREHSSNNSQDRRNNASAKAVQTTLRGSSDDEGITGHDVQHAVHGLTARLNELRRENDEMQRQDKEDERQFLDEREVLTERRDRLRLDLREKEEGSKDLKKAVAYLERQNIAAQQKKTNQERVLETKQSERRKVREDVETWDREVIRLQEAMKWMAEEKLRVEADSQEKAEISREDREPDLQVIKQLEEQVRDLGRHVKELENGKTNNTDSPSAPLDREDSERLEETKSFNGRIDDVKRAIERNWTECARSSQYLLQLEARCASLQSQSRISQQNVHEPYNGTEATSVHASPAIPLRTTSGRITAGPYNGSHVTTSPYDQDSAYSTALHNRFSGITPDSDRDNYLHEPPSQADIERLTGGAMISPSANALLPSGLLGEDTEILSRHHASRFSQPGSDDLASRPSSTAPTSIAGYPNRSASEEAPFLPGLGTMPSYGSSNAVNQPHPYSPGQANNSRSPSMTSSPHESVSGFHQNRLSEGTIDSDGRSLRSNSGSVRNNGGRGRLLGDMFSRQRGKTTSDDGPSLGSLKAYQSRSMPRQYNQAGSEVDAGSPEQKRTTSGGLFDSMSHAVRGRRALHSSRVAENDDETSLVENPTWSNAQSRTESRINPWSSTSLDQGYHSRPSSVYSSENMLPRPSTDSQPFGWNEGALGRSNTSRSARHRMSPWSAYGSRRGSAQVNDPTGSGSITRLDEDVLPPEDEDGTPVQAPIGTKPSKFSMRKNPPHLRGGSPTRQLNPNARDFKSMFSRDRRAEKAGAKGKAKEKVSPNDGPTSPMVKATTDSKMPRDSNDYSATDSLEDLHPNGNGESVPPTPTDGTPTNRESLMRKLTRKSSQLPGLKPKKSTAPSTPVMGADDTEEDGPSTSTTALARTPSSITSSPKVSHDKEKDRDRDGLGKRSSGFSLSSFKRRSRKEGKDAPSISETSIASETGDENGSERVSVDDY